MRRLSARLHAVDFVFDTEFLAFQGSDDRGIGDRSCSLVFQSLFQFRMAVVKSILASVLTH
ncbi:hypothetical protein F11_05390 [Rhodospirillum rubrum F11]|nr:hypothetical protein F11_05390 [Rhodospirillum rubrum F11]